MEQITVKLIHVMIQTQNNEVYNMLLNIAQGKYIMCYPETTRVKHITFHMQPTLDL